MSARRIITTRFVVVLTDVVCLVAADRDRPGAACAVVHRIGEQ
jgi:hypothetical protein